MVRKPKRFSGENFMSSKSCEITPDGIVNYYDFEETYPKKWVVK